MGSTAWLLVIGFVFHVVFIKSVFDCYFTSPVVHGMESFNVGSKEAKRLVLIVGDGLRADLLFQPNGFSSFPGGPAVVAPHLRYIAETRGAFGISHTRVPTESRPGHVAIIGGMYEDVSAVAKGWKTNPVDFDSIFNQSSHTYSFGSPDILPMFARGALPGRVKEWSYDEDAEDFTQDATNLDIWVFDQLETLFNNATTDSSLNADLNADKVIIFLHLLGLDTTGHSHRPHSPEYMANIQVVDDIVNRVERLVSQFYGDEETSYMFTADHGMSVIGNHGDGHPDNTRTPLVAWGKGIRGPIPDPKSSSHDLYSQSWGLNHLYRRDVEQADLAALMATLIGINWPVNGVGVLPDVDPTRPGYLLPFLGDETLAQASLINAKVILENYRVQHELKQTHKILYRPFTALENGPTKSSTNTTRAALLKEIETLIEHSEWTRARQKSLDLIGTGLEGLRYLQTYERTFLRTIATFAYTGWAAFTSLCVFRSRLRPVNPRMASAVGLAAYAVLVVFWLIFFMEMAPLTYYLYVAFPCYFWQQFLSRTYPWMSMSSLKAIEPAKDISTALLVLVSLGTMVVAYTHRSLWSIGFVLMGIVWPIILWSKEDHARVRWSTQTAWGLCCVITAVFPSLSVEKTEILSLILLGGVALLLSVGLVVFRQGSGSRSIGITLAFQSILILITMAITASSVRNLQNKDGLPFANQLAGWAVLVISTILPFISPVKHVDPTTKILTTLLGLGPCFILLSISVEGLFLVAYSMTLLVWIEVESNLRAATRPVKPDAPYEFRRDDLRIVLFFLFFVQVGFFGTGNVASVSSFYLSPVYRLIPVFNPFYMSALLVFKIVAPYLILALAFATITYRLHLPPFALFLNALMLIDGMTLIFFFNVTDTGSWLEIGQSISFFVVTSLLALFSGVICAIGEHMIRSIKVAAKLRND